MAEAGDQTVKSTAPMEILKKVTGGEREDKS